MVLWRVQDAIAPRLATYRERLVAYLIDLIACFSLSTFTLGLVMGVPAIARGESWRDAWLFAFLGTYLTALSIPLSFHVYSAVLSGTRWQATLGMRVTGLQLVPNDGSRMTYGLGAAHSIAALLCNLPLGLGTLAVAVSDDGRAWQDRVCKLLVVRGRNYRAHAERPEPFRPAPNDLPDTSGEDKVMSVKEDASRVLSGLAVCEKEPGDPERGRYNLKGAGVREWLKTCQNVDITPARINEAVELLENNGYVTVQRYNGTTPYAFFGVELTAAGRAAHEESMLKHPSQPPPGKHVHGGRIFIGHGRSPAWRDLKDFLQDRLHLPWDEFNREPTAGLSTKERLQAMLDGAAFAFLIMTAEDEHADGAKSARANVIHEVGLFQGRLGFERAIVLLEHGCEEFSNITGITQLRFTAGGMGAIFEDIRRVLEREGVLS